MGKILEKYWVVVILAVICSLAGSALTLIDPGKLSDITDTVTAGITPKEEVLEDISGEIANTMSANMETFIENISGTITGNMETVMTAISENLASVDLRQKALEVLQSPDISQEDKAAFQQAMTAIAANPETAQARSSLCSRKR